MVYRDTNPRSGLSLLEVLAALAIFLFSVVVISQMVDTGSRTARRSQRLTKAALLCESKMAEVVSGIYPLESTEFAPFDDPEPGWSYSVTCVPEQWTTVPIDNTSVSGLTTVHVTVAWSSSRGGDNVEYTLSRFVLDPRLRVPEPEQASTNSGGGP